MEKQKTNDPYFVNNEYPIKNKMIVAPNLFISVHNVHHFTTILILRGCPE